jgi:hypothetical protein
LYIKFLLIEENGKTKVATVLRHELNTNLFCAAYCFKEVKISSNQEKCGAQVDNISDNILARQKANIFKHCMHPIFHSIMDVSRPE